MATARKALKFSTIPADQVEVAPRGRKVETNPDLVEAFTSLAADQAINLEPLFGVVATDDRPKVSGTIRKNWKACRTDDCRIDYGKSGVPHVRVKVASAAAEAAEG